MKLLFIMSRFHLTCTLLIDLTSTSQMWSNFHIEGKDRIIYISVK
jgi:hypothetical protein